MAFVLVLSPKLSLEKQLLESGKKNQESRRWQEALDDYERVVMYSPTSQTGLEAARLGAGLCLFEQKDYKKSIFFFRQIVQNSQRASELKWAQQKLAEVYYEKLNDYNQAIVEYQRLLEANPSEEEAEDYKLRLARSYYFLANFEQAVSEANDFISSSPNSKVAFEMMFVKADALLAMKKLDEAVLTYQTMEKDFDEHPELYRVKLNKALAFEEKKEWDKALLELNSIRNMHPYPDVIDLKIRSVMRRKEKKKDP